MLDVPLPQPLNSIRLANKENSAVVPSTRGVRQKNRPPRTGIMAKAQNAGPEDVAAAFDWAAVMVSWEEDLAPLVRCRMLGVKPQDNVAGRFWHCS